MNARVIAVFTRNQGSTQGRALRCKCDLPKVYATLSPALRPVATALKPPNMPTPLNPFQLLLAASAVTLLAARGFAAAEIPTDWIDPDTGHRIVRLSHEPESASLYFHQTPFTPEGDAMIMITPGGLALLDLKTHALKLVVPGVGDTINSSAGILMGPKSRQVFYTKKDGDDTWVWATQLDTGAARRIAKLPSGGTFSSINADETLLVGACAENGQPFGIPLPLPGEPLPVMKGADGHTFTYAEIKETRMNDRLEARLPMRLYLIKVATGETTTLFRTTDWLGHVQFSPTDPGLLMYCHEGPWHKVDRIWTIRTDGTGNHLVHTRTMNMEIAGHESFAADGQTIWYDLQLPRGEDFFLAGLNLASGARTWYHLQRDEWSVHFTASPDGTLFAGDGGDSEMVAHAKDGKWIYLFRPQAIPDVAGIAAPNSGTLIHPGSLQSERLVNLAKHDYTLEPNVHFTPDQKWIIFRSNFRGPMHVYAVEIAKAK